MEVVSSATHLSVESGWVVVLEEDLQKLRKRDLCRVECQQDGFGMPRVLVAYLQAVTALREKQDRKRTSVVCIKSELRSNGLPHIAPAGSSYLFYTQPMPA